MTEHGVTRWIVVEPVDAEYGSPGKVGLSVTRHDDPGPNGTKWTIDQLLSPGPEDDVGRVDPTYVGDDEDMLRLLATIAEVMPGD